MNMMNPIIDTRLTQATTTMTIFVCISFVSIKVFQEMNTFITYECYNLKAFCKLKLFLSMIKRYCGTLARQIMKMDV